MMTTLTARPAVVLGLLALALTGCSSVPVTEPTPPTPPPPGLVLATGNLAIPATARVVLATSGSPVLTLPSSNPENTGLTITIKSAGPQIRLQVTGNDVIEDLAARTLRRLEAVTVVADGRGHWHIIGQVN